MTLKVVVVDDDILNLEILVRVIGNSGCQVISFEDGESALEYVKNNAVDIIVLDKMMPGMNGMQVLQHIKATPSLKNIPVIIQTGDVGVDRLQEGMNAGAYYYLTKPFYPDMLMCLINAAARDCVVRNQVLAELKNAKPVTVFMQSGVFTIKTVNDAYKLAAALSYHAANPDEANLGLSELMVNAIEHGNLGIGYEAKNSLLRNGSIQDEIAKRLELPENIDKNVTVTFDRQNNKIVTLIEDCGQGFDWKKYMEFEPLRLTDLNGRGIASANLMNINIEYIGSGNKVRCVF